jgi:hypothetical protein
MSCIWALCHAFFEACGNLLATFARKKSQYSLRMYGNIQMHATAGERVLVVAGQDHTAILKDFLETIDGSLLVIFGLVG